MSDILVVDDERNVLSSFERLLSKDGHKVLTASNGGSALRIIEEQHPDLVIMDIRMAGLSGLETLARLKQTDAKVPVIIMTAYGTTNDAIEAMKLGAYEYILKPFEIPKLKELINKAISASKTMKVRVAYDFLKEDDEGEKIIGNTQEMYEIYKLIGQVAGKDIPVLIRGETGTGKELVARAVYQHSLRKDKPFLAVNCAAIPEALLESELFGYEKGAFTDAQARRIGKFEQVNSGTIFLDEIGDLSPSTQSKILRAIERQEFERLGGSQTIKVDVRIIAATNKDLEDLIKKGEFREDLFYRLNVVTINLPPLKERIEDIPALVEYFIRRSCRQMGKKSVKFTKEALRVLMEYSWPGNVRELENCIKKTVALSKTDLISHEEIKLEFKPAISKVEDKEEGFRRVANEYLKEKLKTSSKDIYSKSMEEIERIILKEMLQETHGNLSRAAKLLGISRPTLRDKIIKLKLKKTISTE